MDASSPAAPSPERDDAAAFAQVAGLLQPHLGTGVQAYYERLAGTAEGAGLLGRFGEDELARMRVVHVKQLESLLDPGTGADQLLQRGREIGRLLARVGVESDVYVEALAGHQQMMFDVLARHGELAGSARGVSELNQRCLTDLTGVLRGYRDLELAQTRVLTQVGEAVSGAHTVADLARGVLGALSRLDGVVSVFLGRPDRHGEFQFEAGAGAAVDELLPWLQGPDSPVISTSADTPAGRGPAGRAWRSNLVVRCDTYLTDPDTAPWREWGERFGWRAGAAVPLADSDGAPLAMLTLYAGYPGFFSTASRTDLLDQVKSIVERAYEQLLDRPPLVTAVQAYRERAAHVELLRAGEVEMLFQPVVTMPGLELRKMEALARLRDGDRLLSPADFLPAFGDEELLELFEVGLDQSLAAVLEWERAGVGTGVSLNMPVAAAADERYLRAVAGGLARHAVEPHRLTLELLETGSMLGSLATHQSGLRAFKALGVELAQDDLGSGHSSLLRLRHFDFDSVKIDRSLVSGTEEHPQDALQFLQPISDIAHSLGLHVTLEGLETPGLVEAAAQLGVDSGQGYAIARPMRRDDVQPWVRIPRAVPDPDRPTTGLGGLAAHVGWEHRVTGFGSPAARLRLAGQDACGLSVYLRDHRPADRDRLEVLHAEVHAEAFARRGAPAHRAAWHRLAAEIGEGER